VTEVLSIGDACSTSRALARPTGSYESRRRPPRLSKTVRGTDLRRFAEDRRLAVDHRTSVRREVAVIDALLKAAFGRLVSQPVNIGSGKGVTISELARRVVQLTKSSSPVQIVPEREREVSRFVADITRGKRLLGIPECEDPDARRINASLRARLCAERHFG
jgi:hypothetical protein